MSKALFIPIFCLFFTLGLSAQSLSSAEKIGTQIDTLIKNNKIHEIEIEVYKLMPIGNSSILQTEVNKSTVFNISGGLLSALINNQTYYFNLDRMQYFTMSKKKDKNILELVFDSYYP